MAGHTQVLITLSYLFAHGAITLYRQPSQVIELKLEIRCHEPYNPKDTKSLVWAIPTSLAATMGISYRFLFLCLLRCVTSAGLASLAYVFSQR